MLGLVWGALLRAKRQHSEQNKATHSALVAWLGFRLQSSSVTLGLYLIVHSGSYQLGKNSGYKNKIYYIICLY